MADHSYHQGCSIGFFLQSSLILHQQVKWGHSHLTLSFNWDFAKKKQFLRAFFSAQRRPSYSHLTICRAYSPKWSRTRFSKTLLMGCSTPLSMLSRVWVLCMGLTTSHPDGFILSQYAMDSGFFKPYFLELTSWTWGRESHLDILWLCLSPNATSWEFWLNS